MSTRRPGTGSQRRASASGRFGLVRDHHSTGRHLSVGTPHGVPPVGVSPHEHAAAMLVAHLHGTFRGAEMYGPDHPQQVVLAQRFVQSVRPVFTDLGIDAIRLGFAGDQVLVNGAPLRARDRLGEKATWLLALMGRTGIAQVQFTAPLRDFDVAQVVRAVRHADVTQEPIEGDLGGNSVAARVSRRSAEHEELLGHLRYCARFPLLQLYGETLASVRRWSRDLRHGAVTDTRSANRLAARLVDAYHGDPSGLLGLVNLRPLAGGFANRCVDTAIVGIALGYELGLNTAQLLELTSVALTRRLPDGWDAWWSRTAVSPAHAAAAAIQCATPLQAITSFEAAAPVGLSIDRAYYGQKVQPHAATLLLQTAAGFVDLLQPGPASNPFSPEAALQMMQAQAGEFFDPVAVHALVRAMGLWPPGATLRLNSNDVAVVVHRPRPDAPANRPFIRPVELDSAGATYDLSRPELASYTIIGAAQRGDCAVNPMYVFLQ